MIRAYSNTGRCVKRLLGNPSGHDRPDLLAMIKEVEGSLISLLDIGEDSVIFKSNMRRELRMLTRIREAKGYSLRRLADKVSMSYVALFRLERGETDPRLGTLRKLAKALNVTVAELIGEGKPTQKRARR